MFVAEQGADDRKTQPASSADTGETVPQVVQSDTGQTGGCAHALPGILDGRARAVRPHPRDDPRVGRHAREFLKQRAGRRVEIHNLGPRLAVRYAQAPAVEIDVIPPEIHDLATPASG